MNEKTKVVVTLCQALTPSTSQSYPMAPPKDSSLRADEEKARLEYYHKYVMDFVVDFLLFIF